MNSSDMLSEILDMDRQARIEMGYQTRFSGKAEKRSFDGSCTKGSPTPLARIHSVGFFYKR